MEFSVATDTDMVALGERLASKLSWPFCLELVGDIGSGKTTFVKGLARGLDSVDEVTSPSFTINNRYRLPKDKTLSHYDFYRLDEGGVMHQELAEDLADAQTSVVVEWGETIGATLPAKHYRVGIEYLPKGRTVKFEEIS